MDKTKAKEKKVIEACSNDTNIGGTEWKDVAFEKIISFFLPGTSENSECYDFDEIDDWWTEKQEKLYYWNKGPITTKPVYKLPISGIWVDKGVKKQVFHKNTAAKKKSKIGKLMQNF